MRWARIAVFAMLALMISLPASPVWAGMIPAATYKVAAGGGATADSRIVIFDTVAPKNHGMHKTMPSPNTGTGIITFSTTTPADISLAVKPTGGANTDYFITEAVINSTKANWTDYEIQLGFGVGKAFKLLDPTKTSLAFDGVAALTNGPTPTSDMFSLTKDTVSMLTFTDDKGVPKGGNVLFTFEISVPDKNAGKAIDMFTLRQFPTTVPEPSTLVLAGLGAVVLACCGRFGAARQKGRRPNPSAGAF
jgi:hypothetical protein